MKVKEIFKGFCIKKFLLTILCAVIVSIFCGTTMVFLEVVPLFFDYEIFQQLDPTSDIVIETGKLHEEYQVIQLEKHINDEKELYGDEYPAEGLLLLQMYSNNYYEVVTMYLQAVLFGIIAGTVIYIVVLQKIKGKQMLIELVIVFLVLVAIIAGINFVYNMLVNIYMDQVVPNNDDCWTYIYDLEDNTMIILYVVLAVIAYVINLVRQKILANRLNKQLNEK